jgi:hypothetical protein
MPLDHVGTTVLSTHECLELLRRAEVGRLAVSRPEHPDVFPVNYVVDHGTVVFRTAPGGKLDAVTAERHVTFEVDGVDEPSGDAWSVIIKGEAVEIAGVVARFDAGDLPLFPWHTSPKPHYIRVVPVEVTGRRFSATRPDDATRTAPGPQRAAPE